MAKKISALDVYPDTQSSVAKEEAVAPLPDAEAESVPVPPSGRAMSFEEAKAWALKKYESALRELAK